MKHLNYMCEHESIKPCIDFEGNNVRYTFASPMDNGAHIIDHFLLNNGLFDHMLEYCSMMAQICNFIHHWFLP